MQWFLAFLLGVLGGVLPYIILYISYNIIYIYLVYSDDSVLITIIATTCGIKKDVIICYIYYSIFIFFFFFSQTGCNYHIRKRRLGQVFRIIIRGLGDGLQVARKP